MTPGLTHSRLRLHSGRADVLGTGPEPPLGCDPGDLLADACPEEGAAECAVRRNRRDVFIRNSGDHHCFDRPVLIAERDRGSHTRSVRGGQAIDGGRTEKVGEVRILRSIQSSSSRRRADDQERVLLESIRSGSDLLATRGFVGGHDEQFRVARSTAYSEVAEPSVPTMIFL
jgi:hypothetical protein